MFQQYESIDTLLQDPHLRVVKATKAIIVIVFSTNLLLSDEQIKTIFKRIDK